ncbi:MAG: phage integrase SAM-like domain-containing protein [Candidatus Desulfofervidaceae bacterium]|nr:phage integrase SAM-like domain-containing protein [Candidatus Desulfofervidaceae bacterium]
MLFGQYLKRKTRLLTIKHENTRRWERQRQKHIKQFLKYCEDRWNIERISDIKQKHFDCYVGYLKQNREYADETIRKHCLSLREFFERAKLNIKTNPGKGKKTQDSEKNAKDRTSA